MAPTSQPPPPSLPVGFRFAGVACGIKASGNPDLSLIVSDRPVTAAGVYTRNQIVAAPVVWCQQRTPSTSVRAVVTNSGNANACTGAQGDADTQEMAERVANLLGCHPDDVLVMSTGVIGQTLPMEAIRSGIDQAHAGLEHSVVSFESAADAILTTDKSRKIGSRSLNGVRSFQVVAMAKGAGMIAPNMATMLAVFMTDAPLTAAQTQQILTAAVDKSFNCASVDGHTSTNDTCLLLSSGEGAPLGQDELNRLAEAIESLAIQLAKELVGDGEGASHWMALQVRGASDDLAAQCIAQTVAASPLVKTAITGGDPNWGRIVSAAGYADAAIEPAKTSLRIFDTWIYRDGQPLAFDAAALSAQMKSQAEVDIELIVGGGNGEAKYWSSDLTTDYVTFNSEYTT